MGATNEDEMCNFYVMYYVNKESQANDFYGCWSGDDVKLAQIYDDVPR